VRVEVACLDRVEIGDVAVREEEGEEAGCPGDLDRDARLARGRSGFPDSVPA
jgi:hypothetical protein